MPKLKRVTASLLVFASIFQLGAVRASAASVLPGYPGNSSIVRIRIAADNAQSSDFVTKFPKRLSLVEGTIENPLAQVETPIAVEYQDVPYYFQINYDHILYGDGTVETSGSSITALAMAATYLTGYPYEPDVLSRWFAGKKDDDIARLTYASEKLKLPFKVSQDWEETFKALKLGKVIVVQTDSKSVFARDSHFVVLKGITDDGKILVNDPDISNVLDEDLEEKYLTGFEETDISAGFCYAWIFDKNQVYKDYPYYTGVSANQKVKYASLQLTPTDKQLLARVVAVKAAGECEEGQQMMVEVILNRLMSEDYPNELKEIIFGEEPLCDVEQLNEAELTQAYYLAVERALHGPYKLTTKVTDFSYTCHK